MSREQVKIGLISSIPRSHSRMKLGSMI